MGLEGGTHGLDVHAMVAGHSPHHGATAPPSQARLHNPVGAWDATTKGLRVEARTRVDLRQIASRGWNALQGDLELPAMVIHEDALSRNIAVFSKLCSDAGVELAPHAKTTMSPEIIQRQLDAGAWALTAATTGQLRSLHAFGVRRLLLANVLVDVEAIRWVRDTLLADDRADFHCYVDSPAGVARLERVLGETALPRRLRVLIELGFAGGRTGVRSLPEALALADRVTASASLTLAGVAGFEGLMPRSASQSIPSGVDPFLEEMHRLLVALHDRGDFGSARPLITAGGSSYFDRVLHSLGPTTFPFPVTVVLRSGCYVTHDHGIYQVTSPFDGRDGVGSGPRLQPALELLASVWSRPEPDLLIVGFGRRDVPTDDRLPVAIRSHVRREGSTGVDGFEVVAVNDQHAFVKVPTSSDVEVGDVLGFGISHPCGAFDRWRLICVVSPEYDVVSAVSTFM